MRNLSSFIIILSLLASANAFAFCGFYVAKADADLFNTSSQVILARDDDRTVVTMFSNFQGDVNDFAMVVPVPHIIQEHHIRVVDASIFAKLDAYSGPRLVEYFDPNPCYQYKRKMMPMSTTEKSVARDDLEEFSKEEEAELGVIIEATYTVGEYDILILSAEQSDGLKIWLEQNDYQIPEKAEEALEPYIKSGMKFFVVKVNLEEKSKSGAQDLRPIQIALESSKFMLPIRLGMANADTDQDMIVYAFTKKGRVETSNYATRKIPTDREIPNFLKPEFGSFYSALFDKAWNKKKDAVYLEYAWDLSSKNFVKCDPCATQPPTMADLSNAGVFWVNTPTQWTGTDYEGDVFITRLHVRYNRNSFPQDLVFHNTGSKKNFQGRYVMRHPASGDIMACDEGKKYVERLLDRRKKELEELSSLTGWSTRKYHSSYVEPYADLLRKAEQSEDTKSGWNPFNKPINNTGTPASSQSTGSLMMPEEDLLILQKEGMEPRLMASEKNESHDTALSRKKKGLAGMMLSGLVLLLAGMSVRKNW